MEHIALLIALLGYLFSFGHTLFALGAGRFQPGRFNFAAMAIGAAGQGWYLSMRGASEHACPIGNLAEILIFLSWSIALIYLVIGPTYRLSLMGAFTAPLVLVLQIIAILLPQTTRTSPATGNPWVETHAAVSLVAYGAFGLACVAGLMFLVQEGELKSRRPAPIFHYLPPISALAKAILRLLWIGFSLLTLSFAAGLLAHIAVANAKFGFSTLIWILYAIILIGAKAGWLAGRRFAIAASLTFLIALLLLPVIERLSTHATA
jgi:HemX protein